MRLLFSADFLRACRTKRAASHGTLYTKKTGMPPKYLLERYSCFIACITKANFYDMIPGKASFYMQRYRQHVKMWKVRCAALYRQEVGENHIGGGQDAYLLSLICGKDPQIRGAAVQCLCSKVSLKSRSKQINAVVQIPG